MKQPPWSSDAAGPSLAASAALLGLLSLLPACGEEPVAREPVARPVKLLEIGSGSAGGALEFPGEVRPALQADMAFEVSGRIIEFPVEQGQKVAEGTVLARLDPRDFEAELAGIQAQVRQARTDVERYSYLVQQGVNPERDLELKQRNYDVARSELRRIQKAREDAVLRAPFAGTVARKLVEDVANVKAKEVVLILQDDSQLEIDVDIPERILAQSQRGLTNEEITARIRPEVVVTSLPDLAFPARLTERATVADAVTRTFPATFAFERPKEANLLPGMTAKVLLRVPPDRTASMRRQTIPANAVVADENGDSFVWRVDPEAMTVSRAAIEVGEMSGDRIEVRSGLGAGDTIAISGVHQLRDGLRVRRYEN